MSQNDSKTWKIRRRPDTEIILVTYSSDTWTLTEQTVAIFNYFVI